MDIRAAIAMTVTLCGPALCAVASGTWDRFTTTPGHTLMRSHQPSEPSAPDARPPGWSSRPVPLIEEPPPPVEDIYGNRISDAVARYRLDTSGAIYEEHSPRTEMPRPRPPTT